MKLETAILIIFCFIIGSCSLFNKGDDLPVGTYEGFYAWGFETNSFKPCLNLDEDWLVIAGNRTAVDSLMSKYRSITEQDYEEVLVRLSGNPGKKGKFGHMGGSDRRFKLEEIDEIKKSSDCE